MLHSTIVRKIIEWRKSDLKYHVKDNSDFLLGAYGALADCSGANGSSIPELLEKAAGARRMAETSPQLSEFHLAYAAELEWFVSMLDTLGKTPLPRSISF